MDAETLLSVEKFAIDLAKHAGQIMKDASSRKDLVVEEKIDHTDLVTEADKAIEAFVFSKVREKYPHHKLIGEESTTGKVEFSDDPTWIIDPIDGTTNFVHRFPFVCISIGFVVNKEAILGIIYNPFYGKLYTARKGCGAYCNGVPIQVRKNTNIDTALICGILNGPMSRETLSKFAENAQTLSWMSHGFRDVGSAALSICFVAHGFFDAYYHFGLHCWDMAAGVVILTEAGGCVTDTNGDAFNLMKRRIIAANNLSIAAAVKNGLKHQFSFESECHN
ncbi:inositol monophosphatase 1-like protein [Leptotrombidium deliense]|uniref:Inositol-1-monophosphatase n=1 Tax=Leptotrombidium deliense TaxID=299467 RepID=A0A443SVV9_9ACAR|nr:inositol monophosphatase 1-like protein [Leptotrombidium deliense]